MSGAAPSGEQIEIEFGDQRAVVVEVGGGLRSYSAGDREVLDGYDENEMSTAGRGQVLMPWPNRIADGAYEFDGRSHQLALTEPVRHNAIHGLVRWVRWSVGTRERHRVVMEHRLPPQPGYPFALHLGTEYALSSHGLTVTTTATNVGSSACPFGSGAHPYLTVGTQSVDDVLLRTPAATVLSVDDRGIPNGAISVTGTPYDFRRETAIRSLRLDHAFTDLERDSDGMARVDLRPLGAAGGVVLWVDRTHRYLMLFNGDAIPEIGRRSLAVEPMTCPPNAFRTGQDVIRLEPGDSFVGTWGIAPRQPRDRRVTVHRQ